MLFLECLLLCLTVRKPGNCCFITTFDICCWVEEDGTEEQGSNPADAEGTSAASGGRRHLSAKERKLMKKVCELPKP